MRKRLISLCSLMIFFSLPTTSLATKDPLIEPYSATYSTTWRKGISFKVEGSQTLTQQNNGTWSFVFSASTMLASLKESVSFTLVDDQIKPLVYHYKSKVFGRKKEALLTFDWQAMKVKNDIKNKPWKMDIHTGTLDKLGVQLQLRHDLIRQKTPLNYQIADGGYLKDWAFKTVGKQTISTKLGQVEAIKVIRSDNRSKDRQTTFYFAPSFDYLLVKMQHKEDGESYLLEIESLH